MAFARFENIFAIETASGRRIGFHARNLQVAHVDEGVWQAMSDSSPTEERLELEAWNSEVDPDVTDADIATEVRSLMVNVTQICNLKCAYCAAGGDGTFGDPMKHIEIETVCDQIRMLLHDVRPGETFSITFFGGEPLTALETIRTLARFVKLQVAGRDIRVRYQVITNGTLVTPESAELLASLGAHVTVSLDGPPEINDRFRKTAGGQGSSLRVLNGLKHLVAVRERLGSLSAGAVFGRHHTDVLSTYKYLRELGFEAIRVDFAAEAGDREASQAYARSLTETADYAFALGGEDELRRLAIFDSYFTALDQQRRLNNHCGAGKSMLTIDGRGRVTSCQWFVGQASEQLGEGTSLDHERIAKLSPRLNELNDCGSCWARHLCGGGCMYVNQVKNGEKHRKDPDFCDRMRTTLAKAIEHYAEARL